MWARNSRLLLRDLCVSRPGLDPAVSPGGFAPLTFPARAPVAVALVGIRDLEDGALAERAAGDLHADRQTGAVEAAGEADRRQAQIVDHAPVGGDRAVPINGAGGAGIDVVAAKVGTCMGWCGPQSRRTS